MSCFPGTRIFTSSTQNFTEIGAGCLELSNYSLLDPEYLVVRHKGAEKSLAKELSKKKQVREWKRKMVHNTEKAWFVLENVFPGKLQKGSNIDGSHTKSENEMKWNDYSNHIGSNWAKYPTIPTHSERIDVSLKVKQVLILKSW